MRYTNRNNMKTIRFVLLCVFSINLLSSCNEKQEPASAKMDAFVADLIDKMTMEEKIGQLSLFTSDWSSTGPSIRSDYVDLIRQGKTGAVFNAYTVDFVRTLQKTAVEETRLHIPLIAIRETKNKHYQRTPVTRELPCSSP